MKKTAFLQALLLVILLTGSWIILLVRTDWNSPAGEAGGSPGIETRDQVDRQQPVANEVAETSGQEAGPQVQAEVPPAWNEWIAYLEEKDEPRELWIALQSMRDALFTLPPVERRTRLMELIESGINMPTGIRFRVGPAGTLAGAPDLQTLLLDWLARVDPVGAAELGRRKLLSSGFSLGPDQFVVHLRNFANGSEETPAVRDHFIRDQFERLLSNPEWISNPVPSIAEALDFAVLIGDGDLVKDLSDLMSADAGPGIAHASSIAIERLVDIDPVGSGKALLDSIGQAGMNATARAGFMARLDPADADTLRILNDYLSAPQTTREEAVAFLQYFPNLNRTFSHNLVSHQNSNTAGVDHMDRLEAALQAVRDWQAAAVRTALESALLAAETRLSRHLSGNPWP